MKENCFAEFIPHRIVGLAEIRRAETRSGAIQSFSVQKRFEFRSAIATKMLIPWFFLQTCQETKLPMGNLVFVSFSKEKELVKQTSSYGEISPSVNI